MVQLWIQKSKYLKLYDETFDEMVLVKATVKIVWGMEYRLLPYLKLITQKGLTQILLLLEI